MTGDQNHHADGRKFEYRVSWQRQGQTKKRALYQTFDGAERCATRQETAHEEMDWLRDGPPPPLVGVPVIEAREVGPWMT